LGPAKKARNNPTGLNAFKLLIVPGINPDNVEKLTPEADDKNGIFPLGTLSM
jgi:hypothetical protein